MTRKLVIAAATASVTSPVPSRTAVEAGRVPGSPVEEAGSPKWEEPRESCGMKSRERRMLTRGRRVEKKVFHCLREFQGTRQGVKGLAMEEAANEPSPSSPFLMG